MKDMKPVYKYYLIMSFVLMLSCESKVRYMNPNEYMHFIEGENNGYRRTIESGDVKYTVQYRPPNYIAYKELGSDAKRSEIESRLSELDSTVWFNIGISIKSSNENPLKYNVSNIKEYQFRQDYFLRLAEANCTLLYKGEPVKNIAYHFENNYGLTPMDIMVLGYKIPDKYPKENIVLIYNDELFNNSNIKVSLSKTEIENTLRALNL